MLRRRDPTVSIFLPRPKSFTLKFLYYDSKRTRFRDTWYTMRERVAVGSAEESVWLFAKGASRRLHTCARPCRGKTSPIEQLVSIDFFTCASRTPRARLGTLSYPPLLLLSLSLSFLSFSFSLSALVRLVVPPSAYPTFPYTAYVLRSRFYYRIGNCVSKNYEPT